MMVEGKSAHRRRRFLSYFGLNRDAKLLILSSVLWSVSFGFLDVTFAPYLDTINLPGGTIGILMMVSTLSSAVLMIPFGIVADRYGKKPFLEASALLSALSLGIYFWVTDLRVLGVAELIKGISWAMSWGIHAALLSEKASSRERPYVFGLSAFGFSLGAIIGYAMGGLPTLLTLTFRMEISQSIRFLYLVTAVVAFSSLLPLIPVKEKLRRASRFHARIKVKWLNITSWRILGWITFTNALIGLGAGFLIPWLSYYFIRKFSVNLGEIGIVFAVSQVGMAIAYLIVPILSKKLGNVRTIAYVQGLSVLFLLFISVAPNFQVASFLYIIRVILMNMGNPVFSSFLMGTLKPEERASGNCIVWAIWNVGNALPLPIAGYIIDSVSLDLTLYVCALLYAVSTIMFYTIFKQQNKRRTLSGSLNS